MPALWDLPDFDAHESVHLFDDPKNRPARGDCDSFDTFGPGCGRHAFLALC
jgi:hypothetical protein